MRNKIEMSDSTRLVTAKELERFPDDDYRYELVKGRVIRMSPVGYSHGRTVAKILFLFQKYLEGRHLGVVMTEVGFKLASNPDTVRAPDVAFVRQDRIPKPDPRGFLKGPPDLAVEVLSPEDRPGEMRIKVDEYLEVGVPVVLVVDPDENIVTAHRRLAPPVTVTLDEDFIELGDVIPGFRCTVREIFGER